MALTMKERYARLDTSKLPEEFKKQFDIIVDGTENFADEDLNDVFRENFNDLYDLVESKYPGALKKGGKIVKVKPDKVKKIKPKIAKDLKRKLSASDIEFIEDQLINNGASTDAEMVAHFVSELGISEAKAKKWVALRDKYLRRSVEKNIKYSERTQRKKSERQSKQEPSRRKLSSKDIDDIESTIWEANYGNKLHRETDAALTATLMKDFNISRAQAEKWVAKRDNIKEGHAYGDYQSRKEKKKDERKSKNPNIVRTRDGYEFNRKDPKNKGEKFYDENGKRWECVRYDEKLDECIMRDDNGKEISCCLRDMYVNNPIEKREKGNLVDDCKDTLKQAGYTVKEHKAGGKKIRRKEPRPERDIIKERVGSTFTPILKDISNSEEKKKENKAVIEALGRVETLVVKFFNRLNNLAEDGKADAIEKIEKLLKELID